VEYGLFIGTEIGDFTWLRTA